MWLCVAPGALAARAPGAGPSSGRTDGAGGGDNEMSGARVGAPQVRRQVCDAESCYASPVKVVGGGKRSREGRHSISARLLRAPADPPGWPGAAGLTDAVPALPHHQCLENKQLARKGTGRPPACPARSGNVTFYDATAFGLRGNAGGRERGVRNGDRWGSGRRRRGPGVAVPGPRPGAVSACLPADRDATGCRKTGTFVSPSTLTVTATPRRRTPSRDPAPRTRGFAHPASPACRRAPGRSRR